ncbi:Unannotated [Lentimonas sp. CC4]|nr:Unannotated [Lentimonas sp. CC4]CAA6683589.1 Unannotated [Lentimonas sp. CC6]CAA7077351.1 Unannotated [Lentimonas sp. CC4]CAA7170130.1 Unannotated [Lentimonas sp. CC21]CAA7182479.1 Unannotated [Lentimonas sp. CC8]
MGLSWRDRVMISVQDIHKRFGGHSVLRGLSFSAERGHITGLVGPNGSGKTTTIRILTGFYDADEGDVCIGDQQMSIKSVDAKRLVGYAPENAPLYREQTVAEYIRFIARLRGVKRAQLQTEVDRSIDAFSLGGVCFQAVGTLSKGYRHRVSLAQCLLGDPPVIVLDEPTDGLDPLQKIETRNMIRTLAKSKAVLLTTHLLEEVESLCDRVVLLNQGTVAFAGTIDEVRHAGSADLVIVVRIANEDTDRMNQALVNFDGLISASFSTEAGRAQARLNVKWNGAVVDVLDQLSVRLHEHGLRVVELRCEDSPLSMLFKPQS